MVASGKADMASMPVRHDAKEGRRLPSATNDDARDDGSELAGDVVRSGVASPELIGLSGVGEKAGEGTVEPGPCRR